MTNDGRSIEQTLTRLAWGTDKRDLEYIKDSYTADARWIRRRRDGSEDVLDGREAIVAHLEASWAKNPPKGVSKHVVTNVLIEDTGDGEAQVSSYKTGFRVESAKPVLASIATYDDVFVNEDGVWRIRERTLTPEGDL